MGEKKGGSLTLPIIVASQLWLESPQMSLLLQLHLLRTIL